jgi:T4 beta protein
MPEVGDALGNRAGQIFSLLASHMSRMSNSCNHTRDAWLVARGGHLTPVCDGSIQDVARRVILSGAFAGELFSAGDEFIAACANGLGRKGNPTNWRAANMNHHMTRVTQDIADHLEIEIPAVIRRKSVQSDLFYGLTN